MAVDHPAHHSEFRRWSGGVDRRICQTFAASPAEPGELPLGFRLRRAQHRIEMLVLCWCMSPLVADFGAKVFLPMIANFSGCRRGFRVNMWGPPSPVINSQATSV